jgi:hypothetical protein
MILGIEESKEVKGYFNEYKYRTDVMLKSNVKRTMYDFFYARNVDCANHIVNYWNSKCTGTCSHYDYSLIGEVNRNLKPIDIVQENIQSKKSLLHYSQLGSVECIH